MKEQLVLISEGTRFDPAGDGTLIFLIRRWKLYHLRHWTSLRGVSNAGVGNFRINPDSRIENLHLLLHLFTRPSFSVKSSYFGQYMPEITLKTNYYYYYYFFFVCL